MEKQQTPKIIICILTCNRKELYRTLRAKLRKYPVPGSKILVVDNGSEQRYCKSDYRYSETVGISTAKNKCIEIAMEYNPDHLLLFEDDIYPTSKDWYKLYTESGLHHTQYIFRGRDCSIQEVVGNCVYYTHGRGCLMYMSKECIQTIGGFDTVFDPWGFEHLDYSVRAYKANLIPHPWIDIENSKLYFYSADEHRSVVSNISSIQKLRLFNKNKKYYEQTKKIQGGTISYKTYTTRTV